MSTIFDLRGIEDVFYDDIWPKCGFNDMLRMRRASPIGKRWVDDYLKRNPKLVPELEINETEKWNMDKFLEMGIPVTKVFINNAQSGLGFYEKWSTSVARFLDLYGSEITHLRLNDMGMIPRDLERCFLERLTSLKSITAHNWIQNCVPAELITDNIEAPVNVSLSHFFPAVYNQLKTFDIALECDLNRRQQDTLTVAKIAIQHLRYLSWPSLRSLALPMIPMGHDRPTAADYFTDSQGRPAEYSMYQLERTLRNALLTPDQQPTSSFPCLETISFEHCYYSGQSTEKVRLLDELAARSFIHLVSLCRQRNIQLEMVNATWLNAAARPQLEDFSKIVKSLVNLRLNVIELEMDNLQRLFVSTSRSCVLRPVQLLNFEYYHILAAKRPEWSSLKVLHLSVDSEFTTSRLSSLPSFSMQFLFCGSVLENLSDLTIDFDDYLLGNINPPAAQTIARCCGNVTKLTLTNWRGTNSAISTVWRGMSRLKELVIRTCKSLENVAFVGDDVLGLKKLSLLGLDRMPKLTDDLFRVSVSRMKLTHLYLSSRDPLTNVSVEGIRSLLAGPFADSIEKFPFTGWSIDGCNAQDFDLLAQEFRSYKMI